MATMEGIGDWLIGTSSISPDTIKLLHDREKMGIEQSRNKALEDYYKSIMGQSSARMQLDQQKLDLERYKANRPDLVGPGTFGIDRGGNVTQLTPFAPKEPKVPKYADPGGAREQAIKSASSIMSGPWTEIEKLRRLMEAGFSATDAKTYMDKHNEATSLSKRAEQAYERTALGKPLPDDPKTIQAYENFLRGGSAARSAGGIEGKYNERDLAASTAAAVAAAMEKSRIGEGAFVKWEPAEKETAYLDKYYTGKDPRFAWGDRSSYSEFQRGYYGWMNQTGRSPLFAITDRSNIRSLQGALNDITKREALINSFVDRIEANATIVRDLMAKYGRNQGGRLLNQAQNMAIRGLRGSGDLESLRLALFSFSQEITKVETGQLGIAAPSVTQSEELRRIHDIDLNAEDLDKIIQTSTRLGMTSREAMKRTRDDITNRIQSVGQSPTSVLTPPVPPATRPDLGVAGGGTTVISPQSSGMRPGDKAPPGVVDGEYTVRGTRVRVKNGYIER